MKQKRKNVKKQVVVAVSGGFDPVHIGHVRMFNEAKKLGDKLVVILNNDNWLTKKKGAPFMSQDERREVIRAFASVDDVIITSHPENPTDMSVCTELEILRPHIFAKGGDRTPQDSQDKNSSLNPEAALCERIGIKVVFNVGFGGKVQSSSWLIEKYKQNKK